MAQTNAVEGAPNIFGFPLIAAPGYEGHWWKILAVYRSTGGAWAPLDSHPLYVQGIGPASQAAGDGIGLDALSGVQLSNQGTQWTVTWPATCP